MPLVTNSGKVTIPFDGESAGLIAESNKVIDQLDRVKQKVQSDGRLLEQQAKRDQEAVQKSTFSWTEFRSAYQTVLDVVRVGQQVWDETGQKFADNAILVGNLARNLGTTTEEASILKEVADDTGISIDALKTSMKLAQKDGFEPNLAGLMMMSDEYLKLQPGIERTQYLLDRFGKSGDEMGKLLEKGSAKIHDMAAAMDENLIVTEENYRAAEQYRMATDQLSDSWDGFTMKIGSKAVPVMNDLLTSVNKNIEAGDTWKSIIEIWAAGMGGVSMLTKDMADAHKENAAALEETTRVGEQANGVFESEEEHLKRVAEEAKAAEQAIKDMTKANQYELDTLGKLTDIISTYEDKQSDLQAKHDELLAKKKELIRQGWWEESEKIQDVNRDLEENSHKQQENADQFQDATNRRILARAEELLSIDGLTTEEKNGLIERGLAMGVYTKEAAAKMREEESAARNLAKSLTAIPNVSRTVTITTQHVETYQSYTIGSGGAGGTKGRDSGGTGVPGQSYAIGTGAQPEVYTPSQPGTFTPAKDLIDYNRLGRVFENAFMRASTKAGG